MLLLALAVVLSQEHVARGDLSKLLRLSEQLDIEITRARGQGNLLSPRALRELSRWPGLVTLELKIPVTRIEARQLRSLKRFAARVSHEDPSLKLLAPALVRKLPPRPPAGAAIGCGP